jgi:hypothetical protein
MSCTGCRSDCVANSSFLTSLFLHIASLCSSYLDLHELHRLFTNATCLNPLDLMCASSYFNYVVCLPLCSDLDLHELHRLSH